MSKRYKIGADRKGNLTVCQEAVTGGSCRLHALQFGASDEIGKAVRVRGCDSGCLRGWEFPIRGQSVPPAGTGANKDCLGCLGQLFC